MNAVNRYERTSQGELERHEEEHGRLKEPRHGERPGRETDFRSTRQLVATQQIGRSTWQEQQKDSRCTCDPPDAQVGRGQLFIHENAVSVNYISVSPTIITGWRPARRGSLSYR